MEIIEKGLSVFAGNWNGILGILGILLLGGSIVILWARAFFGDNLNPGDFFALGIGGGWIVLFPAIVLEILFHWIFGIQTNIIVICTGILIISGLASFWIRGWQRNWIIGSDIAPVLALLVIFFLSLVVRLAFISGLVMPPYIDSPMHYTIIKALMADFENLKLPEYSSFVGGYYHLGLHVILAALSSSLGMDVKDAILIFGQTVLALIPLPMFFIIRRETKLALPALFATVLASWGWPFPAHAVNWGKYPALTSLLAFEIVICVAYLAAQSSKRRTWLMVCFVFPSAAISIFIHTRSLILIGFALFSGLIALIWAKMNRLIRFVSLCLVIAGLSTLIFITHTKPLLDMALDPYRAGGAWITLLVLSLLPFALNKFPRETFASLTFSGFVLGSLFISVTQFLPVYDVQTLLDRPYAEMVLFLPLAYLGGLGYAGIMNTVREIGFLKRLNPGWFNGVLAVLLFSAIFVNSTRYSFLPSNCCNFFGSDDAIALDWMNKNIPPNANILIAASQAVVFENAPSAQYAGSDAGTWITPLIHRSSILALHNTDFSQQETLDNLCKNGINYIYISGNGTHFNKAQLKSLPAWYEPSLHLREAQVYKLIGCPPYS